MTRKQVSDLQVGDTVVIKPDRGFGVRYPYLFGKVAKVTDSRLTVVVNGETEQYNKRTLIRIGDAGKDWGMARRHLAESWSHLDKGLLNVEEAEKYNREVEAENRIKELAVQIRNADLGYLKSLGLERLDQIAKLIWPESEGEG